MLTITDKGSVNLEVSQQGAYAVRVPGSNQTGLPQDTHRTQGDVLHVPNRCGNDVQPTHKY